MTSYEDIIKAIRAAPKTYLLGILTIVIGECIQNKLFVPGGLEKFVASCQRTYTK